jgi:hypothetical protein
MASEAPDVPLEIEETGSEPEYVVTDLIRAEPAMNGCVRLYYGQRRGNRIKLEYTVVVAIVDLVKIARSNLGHVADAHNLSLWGSEIGPGSRN